MLPFIGLERKRENIKKSIVKSIKRNCVNTTENTTESVKNSIANENPTVLKTIVQFVPCALKNEGNDHSHWAERDRRRKVYRKVMRLLFHNRLKVTLPCTITLIRIAPRKLDFDNLVYSFKAIKDCMADIIIANAFNLPLVDSKGQYDGDVRISWKYGQESEASKKVGFYVKIEMQ